MIKLIDPGDKPVDDVCAKLKSRNPKWILLDENTIKGEISDVVTLEGFLPRATFIIPGPMISKRGYMRKTNRLIFYMMTIARKKDWKFKIVAKSIEDLDIRVRRMLEYGR